MSDIVNICTKNNVALQKNKKDKRYNIFFVTENKNFRIADLMNLSLYKLIAELNQDLFERIEVINVVEEDRDIDLLLIFKPLFKELGYLKFFMTIKTTLTVDNDVITIKYLDNPLIGNEIKLPGYTRIAQDESTLSIKILNPHIVAITHTFEINLFDVLPNALQNVVALMVKSALLKMKTCLENLNDDNM